MGADLSSALPALFRHASEPVDDAELAWFDAALPRDAGDILDLSCGAGRLLVPLVAGGRRVHGVDRDSAALALCTTRLREAGAEATLVRQAMDEVNLPFRYAAAYAGRGTFQWLDTTAAREALHRVRAHLLPPARLLLELLVPAPALLRLAAPLVELRTARLDDGTRIALRSETHADGDARIAWSHNRYVHRHGTRHLGEAIESAARTWYSREDIAQLLDEQGFVDVAFSAAPASEPDGEAFRVSARAE